MIHPPTTKEDETRKQANERYHELCQQWRSTEATVQGTHVAKLQFWMGWFGIALVIGTFVATAFAAYYAYRAAEATHAGAIADQASAATADATLRQMQRTSRLELRAYITCDGGWTYDFNADGPTKVRVSFKNTGQTPAHDVRLRCSIGGGAFPMVDPPPEVQGDVRVSRTVLGPGQQLQSVAQTRRALTATEIDLVRQGAIAIWAIGRVTYVDIFGGEQTTNFRLYYGGNSGTPADGNMSYDAESNDAT